MTSLKTHARLLARLAALAARTAMTACDGILQTEPVTSLPQDQMIQDAATATASLNGAYDALQSGSYYGLSAPLVGDLAADNAVWSGTFQFLGEMQTNRMQADNAEVTGLWSAIYRSINRANLLINIVPSVASIPEPIRSDVMGQAYFIRALGFHNLVKYWGPVPIPTAFTTGPDESKAYVRTPVNDVYTQVLRDLDSAQVLTRNITNTRYATPTAARALRARVLFYRAEVSGNANRLADYQAALDAANQVLAGRDTLVVPYADLFSALGSNTSEDIFRVAFNATESNGLSNYYLSVGRAEVAPSSGLDAAYPAGDIRKAVSVRPSSVASRPLNGTKWSARPGTEHVHVIRLAEVVLIKAEALARLNRLPEAVAQYNKVRIRAGLAPHTLGNQVTTQDAVINQIELERRLELALEGDRWSDLIRLGKVLQVKVLQDRPGQALFPIPIRDTRVSPLLMQNPGY
ncbi:RagB/SusD family nutrient uptake outer membrane protein [Gemmatimonas sp.]|uniref:RagB/SusD family nutrient uptake outer membrane protein n=1 Tax=Gemmatimonas sp. TaxID=1962908 RepID=UPI003565FCAA